MYLTLPRSPIWYSVRTNNDIWWYEDNLPCGSKIVAVHNHWHYIWSCVSYNKVPTKPFSHPVSVLLQRRMQNQRVWWCFTGDFQYLIGILVHFLHSVLKLLNFRNVIHAQTKQVLIFSSTITIKKYEANVQMGATKFPTPGSQYDLKMYYCTHHIPKHRRDTFHKAFKGCGIEGNDKLQ